MPRKRIAHGKQRVKELLSGQKVNLQCGRLCGGVGPGWAFESEAEREAAWRDHAHELLQASPPGRRPAAYWDYDNQAERIPFETDLQLLYRLELLRTDEVDYLAARGQYPPAPADGRDPCEMFDDMTFSEKLVLTATEAVKN